jgi:hypothetical protein
LVGRDAVRAIIQRRDWQRPSLAGSNRQCPRRRRLGAREALLDRRADRAGAFQIKLQAHVITALLPFFLAVVVGDPDGDGLVAGVLQLQHEIDLNERR